MNAPSTRFWARLVALVVLPLVPAALNGLLHREAIAWTPPEPGDVTAENPLQPWEVTMATVTEWAELTDVLWVDARSQAEFDGGHVAGAVRLTDTEWDALFLDFLSAWEPPMRIVIYCGEGCERAEAVRTKLIEQLQLEDARVLRGGYEAWVAAQ
ncbi:MAG: rhodanese-like domain-containing protein [Opitutales bacterium]